MTRWLIGLWLSVLLVSTASAAQLAEWRFPYEAASGGSYACNGGQHDWGFALDYANANHIRHIRMYIIGAIPGQYGTVTLAPSVPPGQPAKVIAAMTGTNTSAESDFVVNGFLVPAAQALSLEWACSGGGMRTLSVVIFYTISAGPNP